MSLPISVAVENGPSIGSLEQMMMCPPESTARFEGIDLVSSSLIHPDRPPGSASDPDHLNIPAPRAPPSMTSPPIDPGQGNLTAAMYQSHVSRPTSAFPVTSNHSHFHVHSLSQLPPLPDHPSLIGLSPQSQDPSSGNRRTTHPASKTSPESRLASVAGDSTAPFQPLTHHPRIWQNKESSQPTSPAPHEPDHTAESGSSGVFEAKVSFDDEPVGLGIITMDTALTLVDFYFANCHQFLPIIAPVESQLALQSYSGYLLTTILAIARRFHPDRNHLTSSDDTSCKRIAQLAYSHLAASLFRKQHRLADVQASLLLAGYGLLEDGQGPDPWVVTGHAARVASRLGLYRVHLTSASVSKREEVDKLLAQWRTWMAWYSFDGLLSLGFGRPQSAGQSYYEEQFLQLSLNRRDAPPEETQGDAYLASLVQLSRIGRQLISAGQALNDRGYQCSGEEILSILTELNNRLDDWATKWTWNGSLRSLQLGSSRSLAALQQNHLRLNLNTLALRVDPVRRELSADRTRYIRLAIEAAIGIVQLHLESSSGQSSLSYAIDYITMSLAQAAVFLIRIHILPPDPEPPSSGDPCLGDRAVLSHYIRTAIDLLERTDQSETRNSTYLAKVCRDLCVVAGLTSAVPEAGTGRKGVSSEAFQSIHQAVDLEGLFSFESVEPGGDWDLAYMLGLAGSSWGPSRAASPRNDRSTSLRE
ncbi:hypothetical protein I302_108583 [Kwoniella bestiolae CBS 10118]|uniref:Xylanolytic transcriptional activator regulatory domain-containing protein n=1 Tax=Kwoniella bestiolae CBS 10118 TaxID=1296100 RepID=A0A1B9FTI9_9TREE|nr:hypothetical protein I302_07721 [Kwoniella bestiolae CBS 10118]OCF22080.1 hypothetical protein I302_07721 [Kwoniella bestiolae CBS 10118]